MPAIDKFQGEKKSYEMPSNQLFPITPDDVNELVFIPRSIYIGISGDLAVTDEFNNDVIFTNCFQGTWLPIRVKKVLATGTSALNLIGMV
jgi:hypothetical protein